MRTLPLLTLALGLGLGLAPHAWAQYKVVGPDGRVTYSDRPPPGTEAGTRVSTMRGGVAASSAAGEPDPTAALPPALRPVAARFPVTLYTSSDCEPCARARQLLRARGIPYAERTVVTDADTQALQRLTGARTVPVLGVGQQMLRGLLDSEWHATLDLAGYPTASALPATWTAPAPKPLVNPDPRPAVPAAQPNDTPTRPAGPAPAAPLPAPRPAGDPAPPGIRF